ncbi:MAG: GNAT family N-acetyltransferase [Thermoflexales bacterium]|nr:GNAT family N-acetyltransferase [Thermoflexales bacterium]
MANIRRLTLDDYDAIVGLWQQTGLHSLRLQGRDSRQAMAAQLAAGQVILGLEEAGQLIGAVVVTHDTRKGWINRLAIHPDHRRQGHAARLVAAAEDELRGLGYGLFAALIEDDNAASKALFAHEGYKMHAITYVSKRDNEDV